jgi:carbohydrate-selective porin OprB
LTGNVAPSMTGLHVFLGHYGQTIRSDEKGAQVTAFYAGAVSDETARLLFTEHRVGYVMYGPFERAIYDGFRAPIWLKPVYRQGDVEVFEVTQELEASPQ